MFRPMTVSCYSVAATAAILDGARADEWSPWLASRFTVAEFRRPRMGSTLVERWTSIWRTLGSEEVVTLRGPRGVVRGCSRMVQGWPGDRPDPSHVEGHERSRGYDRLQRPSLTHPRRRLRSRIDYRTDRGFSLGSVRRGTRREMERRRRAPPRHRPPAVDRSRLGPTGAWRTRISNSSDGRAADEWYLLDDSRHDSPNPPTPARAFPGQLGLPFQPSSLHGLRRHLAVTR